MVREPFGIRDLQLEGIAEQAEKYKATDEGASPELVREIVADYLSRMHEGMPGGYRLDHEITDKVSPGEVDGPDLVAKVLARLESTSEMAQLYSDLLVTDLIAKLYEKGNNRFVLDYRRFSGTYAIVGTGLKGKEYDPIIISALGSDETPIINLGHSAHHTIFYAQGQTQDVGYDARSCTFILDRMPWDFGLNAIDCTFYIGQVQEINWNSRGRLTDALLEGEEMENTLNVMLDHSNQIYIPDGKGGWREVRPE